MDASDESDAAAGADVIETRRNCSMAGWCETALPAGLDVVDIWPFPSRAFAIATSPTINVKILEWDESDPEHKWRYIDDNTQNEPGVGAYAGNIWAPNENEIYYAVAPGYVYHGTRGTPWVWTRYQLEDKSHVGDPTHAGHDHGAPYYREAASVYPAIGVWGTSAEDVYAWYSNTIYYWRAGGGGTPGWIDEYTADDADDTAEHLFFLTASGTGRDDVWFSAARDRYPGGGSCVILVHKTSEGYARVTDGIIPAGAGLPACAERGGVALFGGSFGWFTDIQAHSQSGLVGLKGTRNVMQVALTGDGMTFSESVVPTTVVPHALSSLWGTSNDVWLTSLGAFIPGGGEKPTATIVARVTNLEDGGTYETSSIAVNGSPIKSDMRQIRGTSNTNLWAVGAGYALHKTTP